MIERYNFDQETLPVLPLPHDAIIDRIEHKDDFLILYFEHNIDYHDSIKYLHPNIDTLIIRIHLDDFFDEKFGFYERRKSLLGISYVLKNNKKFIKKLNMNAHKHKIIYSHHYISYKELIIDLWGFSKIWLHINLDYIEYEWI